MLLDGKRDEFTKRLASRTRPSMPARLPESPFYALEHSGPNECALILPGSWPVEKLRDAALHRTFSDVTV